MQNMRRKSSGWASFDLNHRQKARVESQFVDDPYPPVSNVNSKHADVVSNRFPGKKSYSSVTQSSMNFQPPSFTSKCEGKRNNTSENYFEANTISSLECLKKIHNWASKDLIQDILEATNNDRDQVSAILRSMAPSDPQMESTDLPGMSSFLCDNQGKNLPREKGGESGLAVETKLSDHTDGKHTIESPFFAPTEPDWKEDDDIYGIYRTDAIKMMRIASHHSQVANNSFLRGDHSSARQYSSKAQEEWKIAEKLNAKAAKEILSIRNINNDMWKLDLHGLHALEAVTALKEHLLRIESKERTKFVQEIERPPLIAPVGVFDKKTKTAKPQAMPQQKQKMLHVITGTGSHSQGEATLPMSVRSFLIENGYRFDDARPGVYVIRPKFRR